MFPPIGLPSAVRASSRSQRQVTDVHRRLGDPIHVHQHRHRLRVAAIPVLQPRLAQHFAAKDDVTQREPGAELRVLPIGLHELIEGGWRLVEHGHPLLTSRAGTRAGKRVTIFGTTTRRPPRAANPTAPRPRNRMRRNGRASTHPAGRRRTSVWWHRRGAPRSGGSRPRPWGSRWSPKCR